MAPRRSSALKRFHRSSRALVHLTVRDLSWCVELEGRYVPNLERVERYRRPRRGGLPLFAAPLVRCRSWLHRGRLVLRLKWLRRRFFLRPSSCLRDDRGAILSRQSDQTLSALCSWNDDGCRCGALLIDAAKRERCLEPDGALPAAVFRPDVADAAHRGRLGQRGPLPAQRSSMVPVLRAARHLVYAASHRCWTIRRLIAVLATSLTAFTCIYAATGTLYGNGGWDWSSLPFGLVRVSYGFFFGVLIERLRPTLVRLPSIASVFVVMLFPVMLSLPGTIWLFCSILLGMPLLVALAVATEPPPALATIFCCAGTISYPLYAVHKPVHALVAAIIEKLGIRISVVTADLLLIAFLVLGAFYLEQAYDRPLRAFLSGKSRGVAAEPASA